MNLIRFNNPASVFSNMFEDFYRNDFSNASVPAVNIKEAETSFNLELAAPGYEKNDFKISLDNNLLTISSEKTSETEDKDSEEFTRKEFSKVSFSRSFTLPKSINLDKISADYNNGILSVVLPKHEDQKVAVNRQIEIR